MAVAVVGNSLARTTSSPTTASFLTRSFIFTPCHTKYRAGKHSRQDIAVTYRVFSDLPPNSIRRSLDPYRVRSLNGTRTGSRSFHSGPQSASSASSAGSSSPIPHISLHIAASSSGKGRKFRPEHNTREYDPHTNVPLGVQEGRDAHAIRQGRPDSGQDAYFVARVGSGRHGESATAFGIADGVGGWTEHGIDPADFSHGLCSYMAKSAMAWDDEKNLNPKALLEMGYSRTIKDPMIEAGGSTACVAVTETDGRMRVANLGDSGFLQLRLGTVHHYSNPQTHAFNTPYQLSLTPPDILAQATLFGGVPLNDQPDRADLADHMLRHGDVLVLATDGVWDNLDAQSILKIVSKTMRESGVWERTQGQGGYAISDAKLSQLVQRQAAGKKLPSGGAATSSTPSTLQALLATLIVGEAKSASLNAKRDGPFAKAVQKEYPYDPYHGGKVDDICALVVIPVDSTKIGPKDNDDVDAAKEAQSGVEIKAKL